MKTNLVESLILPKTDLEDRCWYEGTGRTGVVGLWDAINDCFWCIAISELTSPVNYPDRITRTARLKQENYYSDVGGTFKPYRKIYSDV